MEQTRGEAPGFFDVITDRRTYLSLTYLLLSFPLGIIYFVYITAGILIGISLVPVLIGIPLLYVFILSVRLVMKFERKLAAFFLGININERARVCRKGTGVLVSFRESIFDIELWKALTYLILKFCFGMPIFVLCISLLSISLVLTASPIIYQAAANSCYIEGMHFGGLLGLLGISAEPMQEVLVFMLAGVLLGLGSLHLFNKISYMAGSFLKLMSPAQDKY